MRIPTNGLYLLLTLTVIFCALHPYHAGHGFDMPPAATVTNR